MRGERLTREDGIRLFHCHDLAWLGALADHVRREKCGDIVYYNVNCHVNLTNICTSHCKFCAFGRDADEKGAYAMTKAQAIAVVEDAMRDPNLAGLHVVSGLHPTWSFEDYLGIVEALHKRFPKLYMKGFTGVEITHFAEISSLSVEEVLRQLRDRGGLQAIAGGGAEILSDRVRGELCPNKATADEWLEVARTAHKLGILAAPEALAAGQQPDGLQQVGLALAVVAADHGQLPARGQACRCDIAVIRYF